MFEFRAEFKDEFPILRVKMKGALTEAAVLDPWKKGSPEKVWIDLSGITHINSLGVKEWLVWIRHFKELTEFIYESIPKCMVDQFNFVSKFGGARWKVLSFHVPYICTNCEKSFSVLFKEGAHFKFGKANPKVEVCPHCKGKGEVDILPEQYFRFLSINT